MKSKTRIPYVDLLPHLKMLQICSYVAIFVHMLLIPYIDEINNINAANLITNTWFIAEGDIKIHPQTGGAGIPQPSVGCKQYRLSVDIVQCSVTIIVTSASTKESKHYNN